MYHYKTTNIMRHLSFIFLVIFVFESNISFCQIHRQDEKYIFPENDWKLIDNASDFGWSNKKLKIAKE